MKSLPAKFPIRYAIVLSGQRENDKNDLDVSKSNSLWSQLIDFLKIHPLELKDLSLGYVSVSYSDKYKNRLCEIPFLNESKEKIKNISALLSENMNEGTFSEGWGTSFFLTLFSYEGMAEIPSYWKLLNGKNRVDVSDTLALKSFGYPSPEGLRLKIEGKYKKIMAGNDGIWQNFRMLDDPSVFYLQVPYSSLWEALDKGAQGGVLSHNEITDYLPRKLKKNIEKKFITVAIAKNLESLMVEEIISTYKTSNYCNMCGKALPFDYKGRYCPNTNENIACVRKRGRIRKRK